MTSKEMDNFRRNLIKRRTLLGLSQVELSERCGLTRTVVQGWEAGRSIPRKPETFGKIADALGCTISDLLGS